MTRVEDQIMDLKIEVVLLHDPAAYPVNGRHCEPWEWEKSVGKAAYILKEPQW